MAKPSNKTNPAKGEADPTEGGRFCGAWGRQRGAPCHLPAGWGTAHVGEGRCKLHGGNSPGAPAGNQRAQTHGLTTFRGRMSTLRRELEARIAEAEGDRGDPQSIAALCVDLQADCRRIMARLELLELRADELAEAKQLDAAAEAELARRLAEYERALARVRSVWAGMIARYPAAEEDTDRSGQTYQVSVGAGQVLIVPAGTDPIEAYQRAQKHLNTEAPILLGDEEDPDQ